MNRLEGLEIVSVSTECWNPGVPGIVREETYRIADTNSQPPDYYEVELTTRESGIFVSGPIAQVVMERLIAYRNEVANGAEHIGTETVGLDPRTRSIHIRESSTGASDLGLSMATGEGVLIAALTLKSLIAARDRQYADAAATTNPKA